MDQPAAPNSETETEAGKQRMIVSRGLRFPLDPELLTRKQIRLLRGNLYEDKEFAAVRALVRPEDVVLELGAGMGFMSTVAAVKRRASAVHAFEANPRMIPYIHEVHRLNGATTAQVHHAVLGPGDGSATFYVRAEFPDSSLDPDPPGPVSEVIDTVEVERRDTARAFREIAPSFLICDIEGAEATLLPAADLSTLRCAVVELHPQWIGQTGVRAVFDAFHAAGLTFYPRTSHKKVATFRRDW